MKTLVIYDSVFGNTEKLAQAIGAALGVPGEVEVARVGAVKPESLGGLSLLLVGSPTRGFRPTEAITAFLKGLDANALRGVRVAAFDTRIDVLKDIKNPLFRFIVHRGGYAAPRIAEGLKKAGGELAAPPEGFFVKESEGPMKDGELERAAGWARGLLPHP
jgi:flavodoxin